MFVPGANEVDGAALLVNVPLCKLCVFTHIAQTTIVEGRVMMKFTALYNEL